MIGKRWCLGAVILAGTLVRLGFGVAHELWNSAPDQTAWGLALQDLASGGALSYKQLVHYPHEGGSLFIGLLSFLFIPLSGIMPPLSWVALLVDALARWVQIDVTRRLFGERTALWFAMWTVFAAPLLLPWATIDFGLHALMSFAPFVLVASAANDQRSAFVTGLLCGGLAALAYDVWVFAPAFVFYELLASGARGVNLKRVAFFIIGAVLAFSPHVTLRSFVDHGFALEELSALSVRGLEHGGLVAFSALPIKAWDVITGAWPASFTLGALGRFAVRSAAWVFLAFTVVGVLGALKRMDDRRSARLLMTLVVLSFLLALVLGPFFVPRADGNGYLYYRYFPFIAPLVVVLMIEGFTAWPRAASVLSGAWFLLCFSASLVYVVRTDRYDVPNDEATGWVLGRKFGDDPERLLRIIGRAGPGRKEELIYGAGWGITAALFDRRSKADVEALIEFERIWIGIPTGEKKRMAAGVHRAFDPGITPVLDPGLAPLVYERLRD